MKFISTGLNIIDVFFLLKILEFYLYTKLKKNSFCTKACSSSPCKNGRKCLFNNRNYVCSCANGEYGKNCQHKILNSTIFKNSSILTYEKSFELTDLLTENQTIWSKANYTLLYQANRNGYDSNSFHSKCDGALGTLVLIKSEKNLGMKKY